MNLKKIICFFFILICIGSLASPFQTTLSVDSLVKATYKSTGVLRIKNKVSGKRKDLTIYNQTGSVYATISLTRNTVQFNKVVYDFNRQNLDPDLLNKQAGFSPLAFYPEYTLAYFETADRVSNKIFIYINSDKKTKKYVLYDPTQMVIQSWKEHLLNNDDSIIVEIEFNAANNPLVSKLNGTSKLLANTAKAAEISWKIRQFSGQWIEIESIEGCNPKPTRHYRGWIRWTDGKRPLLSVAYDC